jgi:hypothetical protein
MITLLKGILNKLNEKQIPEKIWNKNFICVSLSYLFLGFSTSSTNTLISTFAAFIGAGAVLVGF